MAEIKSTLEMVLERAERMAAAATPNTDNDELIKAGMRLGAEFMNRKEIDLTQALADQPAEHQVQVRRGIAQTLLRNIVLPRDEDLQESGKLALQGILSLETDSGEVQSICQELDQILAQYGQHKEQTTQQLNDAIRAQLQQQQATDGAEPAADINPAQHPQYHEELSKMLTSLNSQYSEAMDQRKEMIIQRLTGASS
jgi:hypothetical protein